MHVRTKQLLAGLMLAFGIPVTAFATNGMFLIASGANHTALGGVGTAMALDATALYINPAHAMFLKDRADIGIQFLSPKRRACTGAVPECVVSGSNLFALPNMGVSVQLGKKVGLGFVFTGVGGGNTRYERDLFEEGGPVTGDTQGVDLKSAQMAPTIAYAFAKDFSVGFSPLIQITQFKAYGLQSFITDAITIDPQNLTNRGNDYAFGGGARIGALANFFKDRFSIGAAWTSKVYNERFDKYQGLFTPDGEFNIPENYTAGIAVRPIKKIAIGFDAWRILYEDVPAIGNTINRSVGLSGGADFPGGNRRLGEEGGGGFGWENQTVYRLGANYDLSKKWAVRGGVNYGKSPIREDDNLLVNTLAPASVEWHATAGFTYRLGRTAEVSVAYLHAFANEQSTCDVPACRGDGQTTDFPIAPGGGATLEMVQNSLDFSFGLKF